MKIIDRIKIIIIRGGYPIVKIFWYLFRPHARGVATLVFNRDRLLLIKTTYRPCWELPGGGIHRGESIPDAALREITEEVGLANFSKLKFIATITTREEYKIDQVETYSVITNDDSIIIDPVEIKEAAWFPQNNLPPDLSDHTRQALNFVNIHYA